MSELEKAQEAIETAHEAVADALEALRDHAGDPEGWAEKVAAAYEARSKAWSRLLELAPIDMHRVYIRAVSSAAVADSEAAEVYRKRAATGWWTP